MLLMCVLHPSDPPPLSTPQVTADGRVFMMGRPYDFSNLMQLNRLRVVSPGLGRFVGRFTSWFGRCVCICCISRRVCHALCL